eukprot:COSAG01_NODE_2419_length_7731_cov_34.853138_3_plen_124_part_00
MNSRCSAVQLSCGGFLRHPTAATGPISRNSVSERPWEGGGAPHTRCPLLLELCTCQLTGPKSANFTKIAWGGGGRRGKLTTVQLSTETNGNFRIICPLRHARSTHKKLPWVLVDNQAYRLTTS